MQIKFLQTYQVKTTTSRDRKGRDIVNGLIYREGQTYDVEPASARHFISRRVAEAVNPDEGEAALRAGPGGFEAALPVEQREPVFAKTVEEIRQSRESGEAQQFATPKQATSAAPGEAQDSPQSRKAQMEAEGRAPKNPAQSPFNPRGK